MNREVPFWITEFGGDESALLQEVLDSNFLNDGAYTTRFENELATTLGVKHAIAVTSGTAALFLVLHAMGVGPGDEVIVPDVTFIATANAVHMTGAVPVLVDIHAETLNISPELIERAITPKTKAIIPVHVSGRCVEIEAIETIAKQYGLIVIEDAAEALLSKHGGRCLGTLGIAGAVSFSPNKTITTGQGGAILTDDDGLHRRMRELKDQGRPVRGTASADLHPSIGFNFKYTNLQAAVGIAQLKRLPERVEAIKRLYRTYREELVEVPEVRLFPFRDEEAPQWVDAVVEDREAVFAHLADHGIHCRRYWHPIHTQPPYKQPDENFPVSSRMIPQSLWLPSAFSLSPEDAREVCRHIQAFYAERREGRLSA